MRPNDDDSCHEGKTTLKYQHIYLLYYVEDIAVLMPTETSNQNANKIAFTIKSLDYVPKHGSDTEYDTVTTSGSF